MIQNLNKYDQSMYADEGDEDAQQLIHIINHPVPSLGGKKGQGATPQSAPQAPQVSER